MRCAKVEKWLLLYVDGELSRRRSRRVARHLAACRECARNLEALRQAWHLVPAPAILEPTPKLGWQIRARTIASAPKRLVVQGRPRWAPALLTAGVMALGIVAGAVLSRLALGSGQGIAPRAQAGLEALSHRLVFEPLPPGSLPRLYAELAEVPVAGGRQ